MIRHFHCCKDCQNRTVGCHGSCEVYRTTKQERDNLIEQEKRATKGGYDAWDMRRISVEKVKRHNHDRKERK